MDEFWMKINGSLWLNTSMLTPYKGGEVITVSAGLCMITGKTAIYTYIAFLILLVIAATFENGLVLFLLCKYKRLRKLSFFLFGVLSMIDLVTGIVVIPFKLWLLFQFYNLDSFDYAFHEEVSLFTDMTIAVILFSQATVLCINIDCALRIFLLRTYRLTKTRIALGLSGCWLVPLVVLIGMAVQYYFVLWLGVAFFFLTIAYIIFLDIASAIRLNRLTRTRNLGLVEDENDRLNDSNATTVEGQKNALCTALMLTTVSFIMNLPIIIGLGLSLTTLYFSNELCAIGIFTLLGNAVVNPLIYVWRVPAFAKCIKDLFGTRNRDMENDADIAMMTIDDNVI